MNKTAQMVLKIIGASLALAAVICLLIGGWNDLAVAGKGLKARVSKKDLRALIDRMKACIEAR